MNAQDALSTIYARNLPPTEAAREALGIYLDLGARMAELEALRVSAKNVVADVLAELGVTGLETDAGLCYTPKDSVRVSYDTKALDRLAAERPDLAEVLGPCRTEKTVAGALTVRPAGWTWEGKSPVTK